MILQRNCFLFLLLIIACNSDKGKVYKKIIVNNRIVEAYFINDSIIDGMAKFYSDKGYLESKLSYQNGKKEGTAINYYPNGQIQDSSNYNCDLENGRHYVFDSIGNLVYQDYYYFGNTLGGKSHYKNGVLYDYSFENFENVVLFNSYYDSTGGIYRFGGEIINANAYEANKNGIPVTGIFSYFIYPPKVSVKYSLGIIEDMTNKQDEILVFGKEKVFIDTLLPKLDPNWNYYIAADYNDPINKFHKYYITILKDRKK